MTTKRRVAAAAAASSPEVKMRSQKRRKVSDDEVDSEDYNRAFSAPVGEIEEEGTPVSQFTEEPEVNFEDDDMQTAQDKIMSELTRLKDDDGELVAYPFIGKPDRNLYRDYYEIIQYPVSLRSIQKRVRGTDSRKNVSKTTAYPTWQSFEEEVAFIWRNAREYNEDGSEISNLAGVLEKYFKRRVAEAKKHVPDPVQVDGHPEMPRIKLKLGMRNPEPVVQKLTLKMAGHISETSKEDTLSSGFSVDNESLKRQQELVRAGSGSQEVDAHMSPRTRSLRRHIGSPQSSAATTPLGREQSHGVGRDMLETIKDEGPIASSQQSEMFSNSHGLHGGFLDLSRGLPPHDVSTQQVYEASPMDSLLRRPGFDASSALIRNVQIMTHSSLSLPQDFCLDVAASSTFSQQTITINLPPSHHMLTVRPTLTDSTDQRQIKIVALVGMQRLHPSRDSSTLSYDIQLHSGITKIDLEAISGPARGVAKSGPPGSEVDYERITVLFNLLR
ncbi:hypothetical protein N7495_002963 [Penicillium taxi]|uniref:uncharacterized protein n=1 Tax=Penicillium taxi TaxID=168475 RepID=UPI0025450DA3|nr:uncharacterized protein N7495_002963 [Penicillium taxi]KAJ5902435.1 hypothetical protein N7495_002963 [Penicillium taxi]